VYFRYPFCVVTCYGIGIAFPRLSAVIAVTMVLSGGYALSAIAIHHDPGWNVMPNAATYFGNTAAAWAVARALRRGGCSADASDAEAVARAEELARERERARHARILHDHSLQTLESLVRQRTIADDEIHSHVVAERPGMSCRVFGGSFRSGPRRGCGSSSTTPSFCRHPRLGGAARPGCRTPSSMPSRRR
jgi:hypothetical protein